jgi:hypothetical protein
MLSLLSIGALERCPTFEAPLEAHRIAGLRLHTEGMRAYARRNLAALEAGNHPKPLTRALRTSLRRSMRERALRDLAESSLPGVLGALRRLRPASRLPRKRV